MVGNSIKEDRENQEIEMMKKPKMKFEDHGYIMLSHYGGLGENVESHKRFQQFLMVNMDLNRFRYAENENWLQGAPNGN